MAFDAYFLTAVLSEMKEKAANMNFGKEKVPEKKKELELG